MAACVGQLNGQLWLHKENGLIYLVHVICVQATMHETACEDLGGS